MATGTEVDGEVMSYRVMHFPGSSVMPLISPIKCCVLCTWCYDLPTRGLVMPA